MWRDNMAIIDSIGENLTSKEYITNPAIAREDEIKKMMIVLLNSKRKKTI